MQSETWQAEEASRDEESWVRAEGAGGGGREGLRLRRHRVIHCFGDRGKKMGERERSKEDKRGVHDSRDEMRIKRRGGVGLIESQT